MLRASNPRKERPMRVYYDRDCDINLIKDKIDPSVSNG